MIEDISFSTAIALLFFSLGLLRVAGPILTTGGW